MDEIKIRELLKKYMGTRDTYTEQIMTDGYGGGYSEVRYKCNSKKLDKMSQELVAIFLDGVVSDKCRLSTPDKFYPGDKVIEKGWKDNVMIGQSFEVLEMPNDSMPTTSLITIHCRVVENGRLVERNKMMDRNKVYMVFRDEIHLKDKCDHCSGKLSHVIGEAI